MQTKVKNALIWLILGLFIIGGLLQGNLFGIRNPVVAIVGKHKIRVSDVQKYMNLIQIPEGMDRNSVYVQNYIFMNALDNVIQRTLLSEECSRLGFVVSDEKVTETIKKQPQFCIAGQFSRQLFLAELAKLNLSEMEYKSIMKENLLHRQLLFMWSCGYVVPEKILRTIASVSTQRRSGRYAEISHNSVKTPILSEAQLINYYTLNPDKFREPPRKVFKILIVDDEKLVQKVDFALYKKKFADVIKDNNLRFMYSGELAKTDIALANKISELTDGLKLKLFENTALYLIDNKFYAFQLVKIEPGFVPEYSQIKNKVREMYKKEYVLKHAKPDGQWRNLSDIRFGEQHSRVPSFIIDELFLNAVGNVKRIDKDNISYFIVADNIVHSPVQHLDLERVRAYVDSSILDTLLPAALASLRLRYKVSILI